MVLALQSLLGVALIPLAAYAMSEARGRIDVQTALRTSFAGLGLMLVMALLLLKVPQARFIFEAASAVVDALQRATDAGMQLVFGYLAGGPAPFDATRPEAAFVLAFRGLPLIVLISALTRLLYYWGVLQWVVALFATMVTGMATVAGTVMALYAVILEPVLPGAAGHVLAASLINTPAALLLSRLAVAEGFADGPTTTSVDFGGEAPRSSMDAIAAGTTDGVRLLAAVVAMLVVATALVALANALLGAVVAPFGLSLTFERILGWFAAPVAFLIGIPWGEAATAGSLIAKKLVLNELVAYIDLARLPPEALSPRSRLILTYALCGFANLGSLGIMVGGMTAMAPERRADIVELAPRAVLMGLMATLLSGAVVGTIVWQ